MAVQLGSGYRAVQNANGRLDLVLRNAFDEAGISATQLGQLMRTMPEDFSVFCDPAEVAVRIGAEGSVWPLDLVQSEAPHPFPFSQPTDRPTVQQPFPISQPTDRPTDQQLYLVAKLELSSRPWHLRTSTYARHVPLPIRPPFFRSASAAANPEGHTAYQPPHARTEEPVPYNAAISSSSPFRTPQKASRAQTLQTTPMKQMSGHGGLFVPLTPGENSNPLSNPMAITPAKPGAPATTPCKSIAQRGYGAPHWTPEQRRKGSLNDMTNSVH